LTALFFLPLAALAADEESMTMAHAGISADQLNFFEKNIRPVLVEHCYKCHSSESEKIKGGLTLDTRQGSVLGGESGHPGITPGSLAESSIYQAMTWADDEMQMPPKNKLPADVLALFKQWIDMGAPDPREQKVANASGGRREIKMDEGASFGHSSNP
jgi:hypothetical protein